MLRQSLIAWLRGASSKVDDGMLREGSLAALGMGSGKKANTAEECPMLAVHRVQRDIGPVAKRICESSGHYQSVRGQTQCRLSRARLA
jgi:hypothetical protein